MLQSLNDLHGSTIQAEDGEIGAIEDLYFDDAHWAIRYLVVGTGSWLADQRVLISPASAGEIDWSTHRVSVRLTSEQVRSSPDVGTKKPVSRQHEESLSAYYGWPSYWIGDPFGPMALAPPLPPGGSPAVKGDPHLRSAREVKGYRIGARDGLIGHVSDFVFDDASWKIAFLVVDAGSWLHHRRVLLRPDWIAGVSWDQRTVAVNLSRETVKASPPFSPVFPIPSEYAEELMKHYGRTG